MVRYTKGYGGGKPPSPPLSFRPHRRGNVGRKRKGGGVQEGPNNQLGTVRGPLFERRDPPVRKAGPPRTATAPPFPRSDRTSALPGEVAARQSSVVAEPTRTCSGSAPGRLKATPNSGSRRSAQQKGPSRRRDVGQLYSASGKPRGAFSPRQPSHAVTLGDPRSKKHFGGSPRPPRTACRNTPIAETDTQSRSTGRSERGQQNRKAGPPWNAAKN
ncbi:hypothetical protein NDU88_000821 [Pleurodeles waltl]|uniref:Uncharacterized protein n=1 Tax=Pleurodeles waltl TaxID=8319 RepID=A0AAV7P642_PLEWA|nr:hypothetical protein NDU88_000821 [Pleurodeles waltl]